MRSFVIQKEDGEIALRFALLSDVLDRGLAGIEVYHRVEFLLLMRAPVASRAAQGYRSRWRPSRGKEKEDQTHDVEAGAIHDLPACFEVK